MLAFIKKQPLPGTLLFLLSALFVFRLIIAWALPLSPQEAYYWVYSLHPDLSYFDHPPLVAYTILFFSTLFGPAVLSIRLGALLYAFGTCWLIYLIGKRMIDERTGFWAGLIINFLPTFSITALVMTPDSPLIFFWCLGWLLVLKAIQEDKAIFYVWAGAALGLALTAKYTAVFFPVSLALFLLLSPEHRRHLIKMEPYLGLALALLIFSPVLLWNYNHQWASLAFQSTERAGGMAAFKWEELGAFLATQVGILSPLVFLGLCWTIGLGLKRFWQTRTWQETLLLSLGLPMVVLFTVVATREWVKMNWLIPAYPALLVLLSAYYQNRIFSWQGIYRGWAGWTWVSLGLIFIIFHLWPFIPQIPVTGSADTTTGWKALAEHLEGLRRTSNPEKVPFLFSWGHKTAAELQFYMKGHPVTYAQSVLGKKALAYDYWFDPEPLKGKDALFIWSGLENFPDDNNGLLEKYFTAIERLEPFTVKRGERPLRTFRIYRCYDYKGCDFKRP
jgi:4-amino-4-deoxy-L-arabinose transferase-like glycosyltransferase